MTNRKNKKVADDATLDNATLDNATLDNAQRVADDSSLDIAQRVSMTLAEAAALLARADITITSQTIVGTKSFNTEKLVHGDLTLKFVSAENVGAEFTESDAVNVVAATAVDNSLRNFFPTATQSQIQGAYNTTIRVARARGLNDLALKRITEKFVSSMTSARSEQAKFDTFLVCDSLYKRLSFDAKTGAFVERDWQDNAWFKQKQARIDAKKSMQSTEQTDTYSILHTDVMKVVAGSSVEQLNKLIADLQKHRNLLQK